MGATQKLELRCQLEQRLGNGQKGVRHHFVKGFFVGGWQCPFIAHLFDLVGNKKTLPTLHLLCALCVYTKLKASKYDR